jgi:N-acetyl-gamma-glutamyl-phosphate reductase
MAPKIFIDGEHGTTGLQIRARLAERSDIDVISLPQAERRNDALREEMLREADIAILCLPDDAAKQAVSMLGVASKTRIIDTSTAHRTAPDWVYGFAESDRDLPEQIAAARYVSNPGCYPAAGRRRHSAGRLSGDDQCRVRLYRWRQAADRADGR